MAILLRTRTAWFTSLALALLLCLSRPLRAGAAEGERGAAAAPAETTSSAAEPTVEAARALWDRFRAALRRGAMEEAHACFSPRARASMPFEDFCQRYSPLTAAAEAVNAEPAESHAYFGGEKAVFRFLVPAGPDRPETLIQAFLVRESAGWRLVTEEEWPRAALEADARLALRRLAEVCRAEAEKSGGELPASYLAFRTTHRDLVDAPLLRVVERSYAIRFHPASGEMPWRIEIRSRRADIDLQAYAIGAEGALTPLQGAEGTP